MFLLTLSGSQPVERLHTAPRPGDNVMMDDLLALQIASDRLLKPPEASYSFPSHGQTSTLRVILYYFEGRPQGVRWRWQDIL